MKIGLHLRNMEPASALAARDSRRTSVHLDPRVDPSNSQARRRPRRSTRSDSGWG